MSNIVIRFALNATQKLNLRRPRAARWSRAFGEGRNFSIEIGVKQTHLFASIESCHEKPLFYWFCCARLSPAFWSCRSSDPIEGTTLRGHHLGGTQRLRTLPRVFARTLRILALLPPRFPRPAHSLRRPWPVVSAARQLLLPISLPIHKPLGRWHNCRSTFVPT
jgi:hypothetical protein